MKVCVGFCRTTMKLFGKFLRSRMSSLVRGLFPMRGCSRIVRNSGFDLLLGLEYTGIIAAAEVLGRGNYFLS